MRKTSVSSGIQGRLAIDTKELQAMLCCGRDTAVRIGLEAHARVQIGKRVLWNVDRVQRYLNSVSGGDQDE